VRSNGPYRWRRPQEYYLFPQVEAFKTEIGSMSIPTIESIRAMMPQKDWETINNDWAEHDYARGAQQGGRNAPMYLDELTRRFGAPANLADFVRKGQLANYEAYRAVYEGRFAKMFDPCTAVLIWMSHPAQPSFVWQLYAHDLEPNASFFAAKHACEPVHIMLNQLNDHAMLINHLPSELKDCTARVRVFNLTGELVHEEQRAIAVAVPTHATDLGEIAWPQSLSTVHFVRLELLDSSGQLVSQNFYWRGSPDRPDDFTSLNTLPTITLDTDIVRHDDAGKCLLDVALSNPTNSIALMAHIQLRKTASRRVLPAYYSDNYISLLPHENRTITIEASLADLGGNAPLVVVDGWNVSVESRVFPAAGGAAIAENTDAHITAWPQNGLRAVPTTRPAMTGRRPNRIPTTTTQSALGL
jgi:beta-mannosidase